MSIRSSLDDLLALFFPPVCPVCGGRNEGAVAVCTGCHADMPLTDFCLRTDNPVAEKFAGHVPLVQASAYFFYTEQSRYRNLVHAFKYRGGWRLALQSGKLFGAEMHRGGLYGGVDVVVPVPLHPMRRMQRGYNQSHYLAEGIASALGKPVDCRSVRRRVNNPSQTRSSVEERWQNVEDIFAVRHPGALENKHILLVDDVLTTGATLISCARAIAAAIPGVRISIATLAVSPKGL